jgi:polyferredoxin
MKLQIKRLISQIFFFFSANLGFKIGSWFNGKTGFCYPFFYCHGCPTAVAGCPLGVIEHGIYDRSFAWKLVLYPLLFIGLVGVLAGRAVCGWACPIGFLQRGTGKIARKLKRYPLVKKIGHHKIERYLRYTKYVVLVVLVFMTTYWVAFMFTNICPVGFLTGTIPILILHPGEYIPNTFFNASLVIFILFFILIFTIERGWCRYFCPVGALLAPFNKISILHVSVNKNKCSCCDVCSDVCPMGIDVSNMHRDPECILCGKCVNACPKNMIKFERN